MFQSLRLSQKQFSHWRPEGDEVNRLSIRQKLVASFVIVILAVCAMGGFAYVGFINIAGKAAGLEAHALQAFQYNFAKSVVTT